VAIAAGNGNGNGRKIVYYVAAIVATILVSVATAFFAFGQQQQTSIVKLEESANEDARQRQVDQATISALNEAIRIAKETAADLETRVAVLEAQVEALEGRVP
jgi:uncharacterized protein HemX